MRYWTDIDLYLSIFIVFTDYSPSGPFSSGTVKGPAGYRMAPKLEAQSRL